jgi:hypothetical protein
MTAEKFSAAATISEAEADSLTSALRKAPASDANGAAANDDIPNTLRFG